MSYFSVLRKLLNLTLQELSELSGLSVAMISMLENGQRTMNLEHGKVLSNAMIAAVVKTLNPEFLFKDLLQKGAKTG